MACSQILLTAHSPIFTQCLSGKALQYIFLYEKPLFGV